MIDINGRHSAITQYITFEFAASASSHIFKSSIFQLVMSPSVDFAPKMEPFDGTNYTLWKFKMKMFLMSKGLWEAVDGSAPVTAT